MWSIAEFYSRVTRGFGAAGNYTIVQGRHIGTDFGTNRRAVDVPAVTGGEVVRVINTAELGTVVVVKSGDLFFSYCHLSKDNPPRQGDRVVAGGRVGRLAAGPKKVPSWDVEYPGTLWDGIHLHLVVGFHAESAYRKITGHRTLDKFLDPVGFVGRAIEGAPAGGNATPLEDEMSVEAERMIREMYQEILPGKAGVKTQGGVNKLLTDILAAVRGVKSPPSAADAAEAVWATTVKRGGKDISALQELADAKTFAAEGAKGVTPAQVQVIADAIAKQVGSSLKVDAAAIAKAVNDDAAARMKS